MADRKVTDAQVARMVRMAQDGLSFAEVGREFGVSRQRVWVLVKEKDPSFRRPPKKAPQKPPAVRCRVCRKVVPPERRVYCRPFCADAMRLYRRVTEYRGHQNKAVARYILRTSEDKAQRRWAKRALRGTVNRKRWIVRGSKTHQVLKESGLLKRLPKKIAVLGGEGK